MSTPASNPAHLPPATITPPDAQGVAAWRIMLRMFSGFLAMFSFAFWAAAGWNCGWTRIAQVPVKPAPHLRGLEAAAVSYKDHFLPGLDLFIPALLVCITLFALTFIPRKSR